MDKGQREVKSIWQLEKNTHALASKMRQTWNVRGTQLGVSANDPWETRPRHPYISPIAFHLPERTQSLAALSRDRGADRNRIISRSLREKDADYVQTLAAHNSGIAYSWYTTERGAGTAGSVRSSAAHREGQTARQASMMAEHNAVNALQWRRRFESERAQIDPKPSKLDRSRSSGTLEGLSRPTQTGDRSNPRPERGAGRSIWPSLQPVPQPLPLSHKFPPALRLGIGMPSPLCR